MNFFEAEWRKK